jgi:hypothetical protein
MEKLLKAMDFIFSMQSKHVLLDIKEISRISMEMWHVILFSVIGEVKVKNLHKFTNIFSNLFQMDIICKSSEEEIT